MAERLLLSEAKVRALPAPAAGARAVYLDAKQPGLQLRVTPNGVKTFSVYRRVRHGIAERITIGRWPDVTVEAARAKAAHVVGQLAIAENPAQARRLVRAELSLGELFDLYLADREKAGKRSTGDMRSMWELYLGPMPETPRKPHGRKRTKPDVGVDWSKKRLSEVTTAHVSALHARIVESGREITANRVHELLRAMYGYAIRQKLTATNPGDGVTPARERDRSRFIRREELPRFLEAMRAEADPWRDYFTILLYVGYRRSAVAAMKWSDIDFDTGTWSVLGEHAKNGDPIVLPLVGPALATLKARYRSRTGVEWVFPGRTQDGHLTQPKKAWARVLKRAGIEDLRVHDLRRTLGSWLAMSGVSLPAIGAALGHKDPRSTQVYARLQADAVAGAVAVAHRAMKAASTKRGSTPVPTRKKHT